MQKAFIGFFLGLLVGAVLSGALSRILSGANSELIANWRSIEPGVSIAEVESRLGKPSSVFPLGQGFPEWAEESVPDDFYKNHGLVTYVTPRIRPQVLLVYFDEDENVVYVSSVPT